MQLILFKYFPTCSFLNVRLNFSLLSVLDQLSPLFFLDVFVTSMPVSPSNARESLVHFKDMVLSQFSQFSKGPNLNIPQFGTTVPSPRVATRSRKATVTTRWDAEMWLSKIPILMYR